MYFLPTKGFIFAGQRFSGRYKGMVIQNGRDLKFKCTDFVYGKVIILPIMSKTMKRYILLGSLLILTSTLLFSQARNATVKDPKLNNQEVAIGYWDADGIREGIFGLYFGSQYELYQPDKKYIEKMKGAINNTDITVVFGSWCGDSKIQVGRFFKVLDEAGFNNMHLKIIGVNRDKNALSVNVEPMGIERIPTFIVYQGGKELGRIVESPKKSLEKDLSRIISKAR